jgi:hypothetical protein
LSLAQGAREDGGRRERGSKESGNVLTTFSVDVEEKRERNVDELHY